MAKMGRPFMNIFSAATMVAQWIDDHDGLRPQARECRNTNGLPHHATLYRMFASAGSFGQIIACAEKIARNSYTSSHTHGKIRTCLGRDYAGRDCVNTFVSDGPEERFCEKCRRRTSLYVKSDVYMGIDVSVNRVEIERWGMYTHSVRNEYTFEF